MFAKSKVSQSMIDAVKKVLGESSVGEATAPIKEPTSTGMKVYGRSYGNSAKAKQDQTKSSVDTIKGPKDKEMKEDLKGNQDKIDANHNNKIDAQDFAILRNKKKVKEGREFTEKLLETVRRSDVPAFLRKAKGEAPLTPSEVKGPKKDTISAPENLAKARNEEVEINEKLDAKSKTLDTLLGRKKVPATYDNEHTSPKVKLEAEEVEHIEERDEGKPGLMFKKIAAKAAKQYGSKEAGNRVAGAIRKKVLAKEEIEELSEEQLDEMINEVLGKDATAGDWIHDFVHSDNPKFAGKSKAERKKMALGAYYGKQNEEIESLDEISKKLAGSYRHAAAKDRKDMGHQQDLAAIRLGQHLTSGQPKLASRVKLGFNKIQNRIDKRTAGIKAASARMKEEFVNEKKDVAPGQDDAPFEPPYTTGKPTNIKDKSGAVHTPMSRARDLARQAFKKVKNETMMGKAGTTSESKKKW